jgi:hypothetical protein
MVDMEKVKKGLECCKESTNEDPFRGCSECPYNYISISVQDCRSVLSADALELLKEQEAVEPEVEVLNEIDRLYRCPKCHKYFFYEKQKYCEQCGQAVKWE